MTGATEHVIDLIFGRWRSQILYAGTALGVFDHLALEAATNAAGLALKVSADPELLYRLLRALASLGLLAEEPGRGFRLTKAGALLRDDHPGSLRPIALLEEGPEHYAAWKHLVPILRDGRQDGFQREFGARLFDYARQNPGYGAVFNSAMASYSAGGDDWILAALDGVDFSAIRTLCDIGGSHGRLACTFVAAYPHLDAIVFDLPEVIAEAVRRPAIGAPARCRYIGGDMFREVPAADAYALQSVLHDWSDAECVSILRNLRRATTGDGRVFIIEATVPGPDEPHSSKLCDIHMMCTLSGRERTLEEFKTLISAAGWRYDSTHRASGYDQSVIAGTAA